ncbi:IclR family transcriptional regulator [Conexibacter sp. CPCC 206217]|uniref:IclR family transcriptional regulator n=1 Tax=Conexibacter sp. CPCC 206217 TaxID=3064574 RepID=UPI00271B262C|nr:helix-turn-helix domain-containing protein [Conexibacter sp. CPCC 206217]MDO8211055.1 helix-turn-helix domain-containing protein [Conexibacter sp. CPCC 206217]
MATTPHIQSIERAVRILGLFDHQEPHLSLPQLTERSALGRASTHRYVTALRREGLLRYDAARNVYSLGPRILGLASVAVASLRVVAIAGQHMDRLAYDLNETIVLSVADGQVATVARVSEAPRRSVLISPRLGMRLDPVSSAQGVLITALTTDGATLAPEVLERVRATRIATLVDGNFGVLAAPVFQGDTLVATMAVLGLPDDVSETATEKVEALRRAAQDVSAELGGTDGEGAALPAAAT